MSNSPATLLISGRNFKMLYDAVSLTSLIMARLWMALIAFPAGLVLSALLIGNDFSTVKVMESVMVTGADALRSIERGEKEGTYRWTECKAAVTEEVAGKLPSTTCSERVAHEGPLTEMLATASYYVFMSYSVLAFLAFGVMLQFWPQSRFALRSKLARRLRIKRS